MAWCHFDSKKDIRRACQLTDDDADDISTVYIKNSADEYTPNIDSDHIKPLSHNLYS